ncbi:heat shock 70 kDa protein 14 [Exaiptasia diaphana]|uniref:Heat shock 70 kDa protein 14 n=1 Tax=Exaiptasia diaphana TaxID=2652724 RepID=A0A913WTH2_EXADI|nr:heat shock 70 kDa protein 14 [Exaiptasia diaphana]KXJ18030.1 Heat shock 70 kDa protein 14 [Exaiptasia diaphana]
MADKVAFGVHVGCTSACVAICQDGDAKILTNDAGERVTPAVVAYTESEKIVGLPAKQGLLRGNSNKTIVRAKRLLAKSFLDEDVQQDVKSSDCKIIEKDGLPYYRIEHDNKSTTISPKEIISTIYGKMHETATSHSGSGCSYHAVLAVPVDYTEQQRTELREAAEAAGFQVLRFISIPAAGLLAYNISQNDRSVDSTVLVYRIGGTSQEATVVSVTNGMYRIIAHHLDSSLGGNEFDGIILQHLANEFKRQWKVDPLSTRKAKAKLGSSAEHVKNILSRMDTATVNIDSLCEGIDFQTKVSRARFESLCSHLFQQCLSVIEQGLKKADISKERIDKVILVGGTASIPKIQQMLKDYFIGKEICRRINPDEVIAYGAAVQASILQGQKEEPEALLTELQCMAKTISVSVDSDSTKLVPVIPSLTPFPLRRTYTFTTSQDNQESVCLSVFEVDDAMNDQSNKALLCKIVLKDLSPLPKGQLKFCATFHVRKDGSMHVHLIERESNKTADVTIETA